MIFKDIDVKELFRLMQEHDVSEVSLHDGKVNIEVKRNKEPLAVNPGAAVAGSTEVVPRIVAVPGVQTGEAASAAEDMEVVEDVAEEEIPADDFYTVEAPLVGTFYRAPAPDADPFVEVGDKVDIGDVLCIVEAMKSMNEIQADVSGVVKKICAENAEMVEFEQALFKIETSG
jgi:acetyl-CoA carboxylase biotin carboxyl carrier protein